MDYRGSDLRSDIIPELHQAIIPSYRFTCCGNITEWGVDIHPAGGQYDGVYTLNLQVWRPSPTAETTGCYSLVGNNMFTSVSLANQVARATPLPQDRIQFQPGDVLGFSLENPDGTDGGVVLLIDSIEQENNGYETEEVWHTDFSDAVIGNIECPFPVGTQSGRVLNTFTSAAPVISISYGTISCPPDVVSTSPVTLASTPPSDSPVTNSSEATNHPPNRSSDSFSNTRLIIRVTISALVVALIITLTLILGIIICMKHQKDSEVPTVTNEAYGTALQDMAVYTERDTYA